MKALIAVSAATALLCVLTGCAGFWEDIKDKSIMTSAWFMGSETTTSVDATGKPTAISETIGQAETDTLSHKKDDGRVTRVTYEKSFWSQNAAKITITVMDEKSSGTVSTKKGWAVQFPNCQIYIDRDNVTFKPDLSSESSTDSKGN